MKSALKFLPAATFAVGLALVAVPAEAQQPAAPAKSPPAAAQPKATPAAVAAAKEILQLKNAAAMYANAVPGMVEKTKIALIQQNLNYQKDLTEIAPQVAKTLAGREKEIGDGMAQVYANEFTEQELKDLVTFYKSALGQKLLASEPRAIQFSMSYMNQWALIFAGTVNEEFRSEMKKRNKPI